MYAVVLQALATDANIRTTLHATGPPLLELAPSIMEVRRREAERAGMEFDESEVFLW